MATAGTRVTGPQLTSPFGYVPALDGVRAVAVSLVIAAHLGIRPLEGGVVGVHIFFVLSGFLITSLLLKEQQRNGRIALATFYLRRAFRLLPGLLLVVVATDLVLAVDRDNPVSGVTLGSTLPVLLYYANWVWAVHGVDGTLGWFGHMWSLAVEEQFYFLWPPIVVLIWRRHLSTRVLLGLLVAAALTSSALRHWALRHTVGGFFATPMVAEMLIWGIVFAVARARGLLDDLVLRRLRLPCLTVVLAYVALAPTAVYARIDGSGVALSLAAVSSAVVIASLTMRTEPGALDRILAWRPLVFIGRISYSMYLWHILVCYELARVVTFGHHMHPFYWVIGYTLTVGIAWASHTFVESPLLSRAPRATSER